MPGLRLSKNTEHYMQVLATKPKKQLTRRGESAPTWIHSVTFENMEGGQYHAEFWWPTENQDVAVVGKWAKFYVDFDGNMTDEVRFLRPSNIVPPSPPVEPAPPQLPAPASLNLEELSEAELEKLLSPEQALQIDAPRDIHSDLRIIALQFATNIFLKSMELGQASGIPADLSYLTMNTDVIYKQLAKMFGLTPQYT